MKITAATTLRDVAFIVCTALDRSGAKAVLSGGGAAVVWSDGAVQSLDLDMIFVAGGPAPSGVLTALGYSLSADQYVHESNPFTLEFPKGPLAVGGDLVERWHTLHEHRRVLHLLTPTDSCRDRLAGFLYWNDRGSLDQAVAVARKQRDHIDFATIERWCRREGHAGKHDEFREQLDQG
jgi:hypothetical protein